MLFLKARDEALQIYGNPRLCAARRRTQILHGPCDWLIEFSSRAQRPIGIAEEFPGMLSGRAPIRFHRWVVLISVHFCAACCETSIEL